MSQLEFFGPSWINKEIAFEASDTFPAKTWRIVRKINERNDQGPRIDWEDFGHVPMMAFALFECTNPTDPSERAFMKIYIQIPYTESMVYSVEERSIQASSDAEIREETALRTLTELQCESAPQLINCKRDYQNSGELVPGGFIVYLVTGQLPGKILSRDEYWGFSDEERQEARQAFKIAYEDCVNRGIVPIGGKLGTSLIWNQYEKKFYILSFELCREATADQAWRSNMWITWGFAKRRPEVSNMSHPLPPNVLPDGTINPTLWNL